MLNIRELQVGQLVDWNKLPERIYRCRVLTIDPKRKLVRVATVFDRDGKLVHQVPKGTHRPRYTEWVAPADLYRATVVGEMDERPQAE